MAGEGTSSSAPLIRGNKNISAKNQHVDLADGFKRKRKSTTTDDLLAQLVDIGRQKLEIDRAYLERDIASKPTLYTLKECLVHLLSYSNLSDDCTLGATEALKDEQNRIIFMTLKEDMRIPWIERQAIIYDCARRDPHTPQK
ncbi:hypothetical protein QJS04_geneDACA013291 [Acorus gramineus]|uniref:Uncharacterized protein n=1 Tax=Acorus gramineus TaxID=55184 RepID=A0AAV9BE19_ACOGR|nr:hypothetical protein QJS04_geneDACA013291 [Acorus gramineus]